MSPPTTTVPLPADPTPNMPLLRKVLDHIDAHPDEWYQSFWAIRGDLAVDRGVTSDCGTAYCIAGHAVMITGHGVDWAWAGGGGLESTVLCTDGQTIPDVARAELGLTRDEAEWLFQENNDRAGVQRAAEAIAARAGEAVS